MSMVQTENGKLNNTLGADRGRNTVRIKGQQTFRRHDTRHNDTQPNAQLRQLTKKKIEGSSEKKYIFARLGFN
jgi:hypothetical protein